MLDGNATDMAGQIAKSRPVALPKFLQELSVFLQYCMSLKAG